MARKQPKSVIAAAPSYKFTDKRGTDSFSKRFQAGNLYPNPQRNFNSNRPRWYSVADTHKGFTASDRTNVIKYSRELFAGVPTLHGAVLQKASYSCLNAFQPSYRGADTAWGEKVQEWLLTRFYPVANVRGGNYNFLNTLNALSVALDVDGEALVYLQTSRDGFPQMGVIPSHRIGQRGTGDKVLDGRYKGNTIIDGVIVNANMRPIAYRILGDKPDDDYDISAQSAMLVFESVWADSIRGNSKFGSILVDALNTQDIDFFLQQGVKLDSAMGLLSYTQSGTADQSVVDSNPILAEDESVIGIPQVAPANSGMAVEAMLGGMINYFKAGSGEKLEAFKTDRPHANVENFVQRLERRCMYGIGWPYEMLNAKEIGGASVRLVQSEARNAISARQTTLARVAKFVVAFAVATAMKQELIPANYQDAWYNWNFKFGELLTVDAGYEKESDRKGFLLGTNTLEEITAKQGEDWLDVRAQCEKEAYDLLERADRLSKKFNIPFNQALALLQQRSPNEAASSIPPDALTTQP